MLWTPVSISTLEIGFTICAFCMFVGGRAHKDIEFQPDEDSPNVYVSWDPKIACIRKDKTVEEVGTCGRSRDGL